MTKHRSYYVPHPSEIIQMAKEAENIAARASPGPVREDCLNLARRWRELAGQVPSMAR